MRIVDERSFESVAFPIIGGGTGSLKEAQALGYMLDVLEACPSEAQVRVVRYRRAAAQAD
jgi:hypothetical protein